MSGRQLLVPADGIVSVSPEDSGPLIAAGCSEVSFHMCGISFFDVRSHSDRSPNKATVRDLVL
jgi:hypothetical protein